MRILVVEDDDSIAEPLVEGLERFEYSPVRVSTGADALSALDYDLVLLDLGLPDIDGIDVCRKLREKTDVPILIVSARGEETDRIVGLEIGADDYLTKPFGVRELVARIRAVMRRTATTRTHNMRLIVADIIIDLRTRRVERQAEQLELTVKEFDLLTRLAESVDRVVTRQEIIEDVWDTTWVGSTKTLDVHMAALRRKLGEPDLIDTVRGIGYRMRSQI